jgi:hypothetical protein
MKMRNLSFLALLVIVPTVSYAQGGGDDKPKKNPGFGKGMDTKGSDGADALIKGLKTAPSISKEMQKANPVEFLLDKKKDLQLSDDEQKELKTIVSTMKDQTKPYFKTLDSVQREEKKTGDYAPTTGQTIILRRVSREAQDSVRAIYERSAQDALTKIAEEKRPAATDALKKEMEEQAAERRGNRPPM